MLLRITASTSSVPRSEVAHTILVTLNNLVDKEFSRQELEIKSSFLLRIIAFYAIAFTHQLIQVQAPK